MDNDKAQIQDVFNIILNQFISKFKERIKHEKSDLFL